MFSLNKHLCVVIAFATITPFVCAQPSDLSPLPLPSPQINPYCASAPNGWSAFVAVYDGNIVNVSVANQVIWCTSSLSVTSAESGSLSYSNLGVTCSPWAQGSVGMTVVSLDYEIFNGSPNFNVVVEIGFQSYYNQQTYDTATFLNASTARCGFGSSSLPQVGEKFCGVTNFNNEYLVSISVPRPLHLTVLVATQTNGLVCEVSGRMVQIDGNVVLFGSANAGTSHCGGFSIIRLQYTADASLFFTGTIETKYVAFDLYSSSCGTLAPASYCGSTAQYLAMIEIDGFNEFTFQAGYSTRILPPCTAQGFFEVINDIVVLFIDNATNCASVDFVSVTLTTATEIGLAAVIDGASSTMALTAAQCGAVPTGTFCGSSNDVIVGVTAVASLGFRAVVAPSAQQSLVSCSIEGTALATINGIVMFGEVDATACTSLGIQVTLVAYSAATATIAITALSSSGNLTVISISAASCTPVSGTLCEGTSQYITAVAAQQLDIGPLVIQSLNFITSLGATSNIQATCTANIANVYATAAGVIGVPTLSGCGSLTLSSATFSGTFLTLFGQYELNSIAFNLSSTACSLAPTPQPLCGTTSSSSYGLVLAQFINSSQINGTFALTLQTTAGNLGSGPRNCVITIPTVVVVNGLLLAASHGDQCSSSLGYMTAMSYASDGSLTLFQSTVMLGNLIPGGCTFPQNGTMCNGLGTVKGYFDFFQSPYNNEMNLRWLLASQNTLSPDCVGYNSYFHVVAIDNVLTFGSTSSTLPQCYNSSNNNAYYSMQQLYLTPGNALMVTFSTNVTQLFQSMSCSPPLSGGSSYCGVSSTLVAAVTFTTPQSGVGQTMQYYSAIPTNAELQCSIQVFNAIAANGIVLGTQQASLCAGIGLFTFDGFTLTAAAQNGTNLVNMRGASCGTLPANASYCGGTPQIADAFSMVISNESHYMYGGPAVRITTYQGFDSYCSYAFGVQGIADGHMIIGNNQWYCNTYTTFNKIVYNATLGQIKVAAGFFNGTMTLTSQSCGMIPSGVLCGTGSVGEQMALLNLPQLPNPIGFVAASSPFVSGSCMFSLNQYPTSVVNGAIVPSSQCLGNTMELTISGSSVVFTGSNLYGTVNAANCMAIPAATLCGTFKDSSSTRIAATFSPSISSFVAVIFNKDGFVCQLSAYYAARSGTGNISFYMQSGCSAEVVSSIVGMYYDATQTTLYVTIQDSVTGQQVLGSLTALRCGTIPTGTYCGSSPQSNIVLNANTTNGTSTVSINATGSGDTLVALCTFSSVAYLVDEVLLLMASPLWSCGASLQFTSLYYSAGQFSLLGTSSFLIVSVELSAQQCGQIPIGWYVGEGSSCCDDVAIGVHVRSPSLISVYVANDRVLRSQPWCQIDVQVTVVAQGHVIASSANPSSTNCQVSSPYVSVSMIAFSTLNNVLTISGSYSQHRFVNTPLSISPSSSLMSHDFSFQVVDESLGVDDDGNHHLDIDFSLNSNCTLETSYFATTRGNVILTNGTTLCPEVTLSFLTTSTAALVFETFVPLSVEFSSSQGSRSSGGAAVPMEAVGGIIGGAVVIAMIAGFAMHHRKQKLQDGDQKMSGLINNDSQPV